MNINLHFSRKSGLYRYSFQRQEVSNEYWEGAVEFKYRVEDARLGRFFSVDPLYAKYPWNSNYAFSENKTIQFVELEGLEAAATNSPDNTQPQANTGTTFYTQVQLEGQKEPMYFRNTLTVLSNDGVGPRNTENDICLELIIEIVDEIPEGNTVRKSSDNMSYTFSGGRDLLQYYPRISSLKDGSISAFVFTYLESPNFNGDRYLDGVCYDPEGYPKDYDIRPTGGMAPDVGFARTASVIKTSHTTLDVLTNSEIIRISNAANRIKSPISVVGSRAKGTSNAFADWDYVITDIKGSNWHKIKNSLPGSRSSVDNTVNVIDLNRGKLDESLPHITFFPK